MGRFADTRFRQMHAVRTNRAGKSNISGNQQEKAAFARHLAQRQGELAPLLGLTRPHDHHAAFG